MVKFTAIILAGGLSSRMGTNKSLVRYQGKPLIQYAVELAGKFPAEIIISENNHHLDHFGIPVVGDILKVKAPVAGIHAGLMASRSDWNLVIACDMPGITPELIDLMLANLGNDSRIVVPRHDGYIEPLCGFYHRKVIPVIEQLVLSGNLSLIDLTAAVPQKYIDMDEMPQDQVARLFMNVNEKGDLQR